MKFAAWKLGFKIVEVPITFVDRKFGTSKMHSGIIKEGVLGVLKIQWNSLFKNYRIKVRNDELKSDATIAETVKTESKPIVEGF
jgi:dolichol-phosphate mannosyltransferase